MFIFVCEKYTVSIQFLGSCIKDFSVLLLYQVLAVETRFAPGMGSG